MWFKRYKMSEKSGEGWKVVGFGGSADGLYFLKRL